MRKPFLLTAASALIFLAFTLTACSSASEQLAEQPTTKNNNQTPQNNQNLDLDKIKDERLRLEQELADYHDQLDQILQNLSGSSRTP